MDKSFPADLAHPHPQIDKSLSEDTLLASAGYLCAIQLLSGLDGFALDDGAVSTQYGGLSELANPADLPLRAALTSGLFRTDGEARRSSIQRSVAECLGARYIAQAINAGGLPIGRAIALMTGADDNIMPDLRGLAASLAVQCPATRPHLIACDPFCMVSQDNAKKTPMPITPVMPDQQQTESCKAVHAAPPAVPPAAPKYSAEQRAKKNELINHFRQYQSVIRDGSASPAILRQLTLIYTGELQGAHGTNPDERLVNFFDGETSLVAAAHDGFRHTLTRKDLPAATDIIALASQGQMYAIRSPCLLGMNEFYQTDPPGAMQLNATVLASLVAFRLTENVNNDPAWLVALLEERPELVASVLVPYVLAMLRTDKDHLPVLSNIAYHNSYAKLARSVIPHLLEGFPIRSRKNQVTDALDTLLKGALHYLDKEALLGVIGQKLTLKSMDIAQRVYWLSYAMVIHPHVYEKKLHQYIEKNEVRMNYFAQFFSHPNPHRVPDPSSLPIDTLILLIELLAPDCSPETLAAGRTVKRGGATADATAELMYAFINALANDPKERASLALEHLLALSKLTHWHNSLRSALHSRRRATLRSVNSIEVSRTLANLQPANPADLAALVLDQLHDIAKKMRNENFNHYTHYWNYDSGNTTPGNTTPTSPKSENDCRDALLSALKARLEKLDIDVQPEGSYTDNHRADICLSFNAAQPISIPIGIKKNSHRDLWSAIHTQLIPRSIRAKGTGGHGIYLVFWFGSKDTPLSPDGRRPKNPKALEDGLRALLAPDERHRILICVIDCEIA